MPYWLLTSTTYGTWLPGDQRGSVTSVRDARPGEAKASSRREHDRFGEACEPAMPGIRSSAAGLLKGPVVWLTVDQAHTVISQLKETAEYRGWRLLVAAVMRNHFHVVIGSREDVDPRKVLNDLRAYSSRRLSRDFGRPASGKWWTRNGSRRWLFDEEAIYAAINYVLHKQPNPQAVWSPESDEGQPN